MAAATSARNPHQRVEERVALIARLHAQVDAVLVGRRIDSVRHGRVAELLDHVSCARQPAVRFDGNERWRVICSLQQKVCSEARRVFRQYLRVLSTGLLLSNGITGYKNLPRPLPCPISRPTGRQQT